MSTATPLTILAAEHGEVVNELFLPAPAIGIGSFLVFLLLLLATMSLRSVALRHHAPIRDEYARGRGYEQRDHGHWGSHQAGGGSRQAGGGHQSGSHQAGH